MEDGRGERRADRALGDRFIVEVSGLVFPVLRLARDVLTEEHVFGLDFRDVTQNLDLCVQEYRARREKSTSVS